MAGPESATTSNSDRHEDRRRDERHESRHHRARDRRDEAEDDEARHSRRKRERDDRRNGEDQDDERRHAERRRHREDDEGRKRSRKAEDDDRERRRERDDRPHSSSSRHHSSRKHRRHRSPSSSPGSASDSGSDDENDASGSSEPPPLHPRLASSGLQPLTKEDYYAQSAPFRHWLLTSRKPKRLNDLSSRESHSLFRKFIDKYNRGRLPDLYYTEGGITSNSLATTSAGQTGYKWGFVEKRSRRDQEEVELLRDGVDSLTNGMSKGAKERREREMKSRSSRGRGAAEEGDGEEIGPIMPPAAGPSSGTTPLGRSAHPTDARLAAEEAAEHARRQAQSQRRGERRDAKDLREEANPRATGRDAVIEKRRETNRANRDFEAARGAGDIELPEEQLMGGGASFQEALAAQSRARLGPARSKAQEAREAKRFEKEQEMESKRQAFKAKEDGTMAMLKELAKSRFGS
ncbi:hypothetical protein BCV69DRAFT_301458 [Microstroma glucosiphilum]|uniref:Uncharacterized protein n=1 Tax=Pseudomicrostroma glucosiphilum TaxID=1684307 RepID=A0A316TYV7_9BASI|nr:hypothetical protein BCV69DRAFT_301458 [Pseudomicrostroma glucosiphilum]PWN18327.1 hypothetical protein BCV69DRAFT_301458 [Pseudomicrostroma glucosiphilum]